MISHRRRRCCGGDHAWSSTHNRRDDGNGEGGVQPDFWINTGDDGEGNGFGHEGQSHDQSGQHIAADVAQPFQAGDGQLARYQNALPGE